MAKVFFSYTHIDESLRNQLEIHLSLLRREGLVETWHDRRIGAGQDFAATIDSNLEDADIILLLVSADFVASAYCWEIEMQRAMQRHDEGSARVIPIILRPCEWHTAPFGRLNAVPKDGKPITTWTNLDEAFVDVAKGIREAVKSLALKSPVSGAATARRSASPAPETAPVQNEAIAKARGLDMREGFAAGMRRALGSRAPTRSSNLRVTKAFTDHDRDEFGLVAFDYMARFFENSAAELHERNPDIKATFRRIDANNFSAVAYRGGQKVAQCKIQLGGAFGSGGTHDITYSASDSYANNSINESLSVHDDKQAQFLKPMGMQSLSRSVQVSDKLTHQGAAELYWAMFIEPLQR